MCWPNIRPSQVLQLARHASIAVLTVCSVSCGGNDDDDALNAGGANATGGSAGSDATPGSGGNLSSGGSAGDAFATGGASSTDRTPVSGGCARSTGDACSSDSDCLVGGCGGELCYGAASGEGITTCDCTAPEGLSCGCVDGACTWWQ